MDDQRTSLHGIGLHGSLRALLLFDITEEIDLPLLRRVLGATPSKREPAFRQPAPEYVRFERPPVGEDLGACANDAGKELHARVRYFDYGVASVELRMPFTATWDGLVRLANTWILSPELEATASRMLRARSRGARGSEEAPRELDFGGLLCHPGRSDCGLGRENRAG